MIRVIQSLTAAFALMMFLPTAPAMAQIASFEAEIDCGQGMDFVRGDSVPYTLRFENQTLQTIALNVSVRIRVPGLGTFPLFNAPLTLGPNQDLAFNRSLNLPQSAPLGSYTMIVIARSDTETSFDTCSFNVVG